MRFQAQIFLSLILQWKFSSIPQSSLLCLSAFCSCIPKLLPVGTMLLFSIQSCRKAPCPLLLNSNPSALPLTELLSIFGWYPSPYDGLFLLENSGFSVVFAYSPYSHIFIYCILFNFLKLEHAVCDVHTHIRK